MKLMANMLGSNGFTVGDPEGEPYVVTISNKNWIPVSVVVFAKDEKDAISRIIKGIKYRYQISSEGSFDKRHAKKVLNLVEEGYIEAEKMNKRLITKAPWASNDYLC